jgi:predicted TIM-barrel fold metal-dependent hydrolase
MLEMYEKEGVYKVVFFGYANVLQAYKERPNEVVPSLYVRYMDQNSSVRDVEAALEEGFMWIGEALLRHHSQGTAVPADHPVALQIYDLCAKYNVPITVHQDPAEYVRAYEEFERAASLKRNCTFVLHGWWLSSNQVERILERNPNVYIELAGELEGDNGNFLGGTNQDQFATHGSIKSVWKHTFEKYQDRIINGFDFWLQEQYTPENLKKNVEYWRNLLGQIDEQAAEKIAYRNVEDLLAHEVNLTNTSSATATTTEFSSQTFPPTATTSTNALATSQITQSNWLETDWQYAVVVAIILVVSGILLAYKRKRASSKLTK